MPVAVALQCVRASPERACARLRIRIIHHASQCMRVCMPAAVALMHVRAPSVRVSVRLRVHSRRRRVSARACPVLCVRALACTYVHGDVRLAPCLCRHCMGRARALCTWRARPSMMMVVDRVSFTSQSRRIYYIPRPRIIPSRLPASATNPDDYVTDHQIWLGLLLVCDGRHCLFPLARSWADLCGSTIIASLRIADVPVSQNSLPGQRWVAARIALRNTQSSQEVRRQWGVSLEHGCWVLGRWMRVMQQLQFSESS